MSRRLSAAPLVPETPVGGQQRGAADLAHRRRVLADSGERGNGHGDDAAAEGRNEQSRGHGQGVSAQGELHGSLYSEAFVKRTLRVR